MINREDFHVCYDGDNGIIYHVPSGALCKIDRNQAVALVKTFYDYHNGDLNSNDSSQLEMFCNKAFPHKKNKLLLPLSNGLGATRHLDRLEILVATQCNLACKYCYANSGTYNTKSELMTPENAESYMDYLFPIHFDSVDVVMFFGGEPTLNMTVIVRIIEKLRLLVNDGVLDKEPQYTMVTNATLIDSTMAELISFYGIKVTVSIDGSKEVNDSARVDHNGFGTYQRIEKGIFNLIKANADLAMLEATYTTSHLTFGISKEELHHFLTRKYGITNILIANCHGESEYAITTPNNISPSETELIWKEQRIVSILKSPYFLDITCTAGLTSLMIMPSGELYPCHQFINDQTYSMGKISNFDPHQESYSVIREQIINTRRSLVKPCMDCWAREICETCPASVIYSVHDATSVACERNKQFLSEILLKVSTKC